MHVRMLSRRAGFSLVEALVSLVLLGILGTAFTSAFISQTRFYDQQEKTDFARDVSRGALNMMLSELRMLEQRGGVASATNWRLTLRVPYALGLVCDNSGSITATLLPVSSAVLADSGYSGYAYRRLDGQYVYVTGTSTPAAAGAAMCTAQGITVTPGATVVHLAPATGAAVIGEPILLYQNITYEFKPSSRVPGRMALWRRIDARGRDEELVAPFDTAAKFRFYANDARTAQTAVPSPLSSITGIELNLDALSERPRSDGTFAAVPFQTSIFFRNRQ
jgi:hypothetical protein